MGEKRESKGDAMIKSLGAMIGGIFVGAVGVEIIRRKYPDALDKLYARACEMGSGVKEAFKKGYENAMQSQKAVEPSA